MPRLEVPVTPDAETARKWAEEELAKAAYHRGDTLFDRLGAWFSEQINKLFDSTSGAAFGPVTYLIVALVIAAVILIAVKVAVPAVKQRGRGDSAVLLDDDHRTGAEIRAAAKSASSQGDHALAALEYFRAMVRSCEERVVIDERAGRTAREAARDIARSLGAHQEDLRTGAVVFDELCYGHRAGTADDARRMASIDAEISRAKPLRMAMA